MPGETLNVVYDCGTKTDISSLKRIIKKTFPIVKKDRKKIDFLFLSHFHSDHISGVADLLRQCEVKYVFLPYASQENLALALLDNATDTSDAFVERLIVNPVGTVQELGSHGRSGYPIVVFVPPINNTDGDFIGDDFPTPMNPEIFEKGSSPRNTIPVGLPLTFSKQSAGKKVCQWCFIPYHFQFSERAELLRKELSQELKEAIQNIADLAEFWKKHEKGLTEAYKKIRRKERLNDTTMTLYSGPFGHGLRDSYSLLLPNYTTTTMLQPFLWSHVTQELKQIKANTAANIDLGEQADRFSISCAEHLIRSMSPIFATVTPGSRLSEKLGALYIGDFNPRQQSVTRNPKENSGKDFLKKYSKRLCHVDVMQEAHHGSSENCSLDLVRLAFNHVLSFGKKNTHGHPGLRTVTEIKKSGGCPHFVTEVADSEIVQNIEILSDDFFVHS